MWEVLRGPPKDRLTLWQEMPGETHFFGRLHMGSLGHWIMLGLPLWGREQLLKLSGCWGFNDLKFYISCLQGSETCKFPSDPGLRGNTWQWGKTSITYPELRSRASRTRSHQDLRASPGSWWRHRRMQTWPHWHLDLSQLSILISHSFSKIVRCPSFLFLSWCISGKMSIFMSPTIYKNNIFPKTTFQD